MARLVLHAGIGRDLPPLRLRFLGHSTVLLTLDGIRVLTDPVLRGIGPLRRHGPPAHSSVATVEVVVVSHAHRDHLDMPSLRALGGSPLVIVPRGAGAVLRRAGLHRVEEVRAGDRIEVKPGFEVVAFPAVHDGFRAPLGPRADALGYLIRGTSHVYFAGDTDLFSEMASLQGTTDAALLPVWGWGPYLGAGHLDPRRAAQAARMIGARVTVPIHWGTLFPHGLHRVWPSRLVSPPEEFARHVELAGIDTEVRVLQPGELTTIEPRDAASRNPGLGETTRA